jgi:hypothetical protein
MTGLLLSTASLSTGWGRVPGRARYLLLSDEPRCVCARCARARQQVAV